MATVPTYLGLHVYCLKFFLEFNQVWNFSTDLHRCRQYQISWNSVQWERSDIWGCTET